MDKETCVVLGGSGFLGQRLCNRLLEEGFRVRSISRSGVPLGIPEPWWDGVEWNAGTLGSAASHNLIESAQFTFHLASTTIPATSNTDMVRDLHENAVETLKLLQSFSRFPGRLIFVSSGGTVYGVSAESPISENHPTDPICSYGIHKLTIEKYLQLFRTVNRLDGIVLRVSNMYGESQDSRKPIGAISHFLNSFLGGKPLVIWGDGSIIRDYVHVDDVVGALISSMNYRGKESTFNIGTGVGTSLNEIIDILRIRLKTPVAVHHEAARGFDVPENVLDIFRAKRELHWVPTISLCTGIDRMVEAWKRQAQ
jgi:UDP-glucose 4-epimerase